MKRLILFSAAFGLSMTGFILAMQATPQARCIKEQEEFYLANWYQELPERAKDSASVYCANHGNVPQRVGPGSYGIR